ncbi:MAG: hypothetical protein JNK99_16185 [Candidatus Accumulibacter sp.]|uniref:hypothetical protein n=1 Tax=Accumulibacter sp. TaxID=2053492 RepID=UPI001A5DE122|nr:hypothetical protein [Accumulibacter sp.]MBL8396259.1 hypothetical protein [Accumulibacter sp.]
MTETAHTPSGADGGAAPLSGMRTILQWLELPLAPHPAEELPSLRSHLIALRDVEGSRQQRALVLDGLYRRSSTVIASLLPALGSELVLPVPRRERRIVRSVLDLLQMLADDTVALLDTETPARKSPDPCLTPEVVLWHSLDALAKQLLISHLIACPARTGAWQQLHRTYATATRLQLHMATPSGASHNLQDIYHAAVLLGCAQPASLTPREVLFLATYFERFADLIKPVSSTATQAADTFWIDPARDLPAVSSLRKATQAPGVGFSCARICLLLKTQIDRLEAGAPPPELNLPDFAGTPAGRGVLQRLSMRWGDSGKRRFKRRRQNHRTLLAAGIDGLWQLSSKGEAANVDLSTWMITNESPDGYSVMHVSGKPGALTVGDVATVRTGSDQNWQICMVRWAVSENPEHLELGLQILAPRAVPAILAQPSDSQGTEHLRVLILPEIPKLRASQSLVVAAGALPKETKKLLLVIEDENLIVREVTPTCVDEQTSSVEILSIEPDQNPF